jgi:hypothetical protein
MAYKFVVIYTDFGDTCDGLARVCGTFDTHEQAVEEMKKDVAWYLNKNKTLDITDQQIPNWILVGDDKNGCQWQILSVEIKGD